MKTKQIFPCFTPERFQPTKHVKPAGNILRGIDRKHSKPKILTIRHELPYAFPANCGNARNPLIFGKIPQAYQEAERQENAKSLYIAGLQGTNKANHLVRVNSCNFRQINKLTPELQAIAIKSLKDKQDDSE